MVSIKMQVDFSGAEVFAATVPAPTVALKKIAFVISKI